MMITQPVPSSDAACSPFSPKVIDTLQTLIAPGKHVRISPFVESVQYKCLFDEKPDPARRYEHMRQILEEHQLQIEKMATGYADFVKKGKAFTGSYDREFLDQYMAYYFPVNVSKLQLIMLELLRQQKLQGNINVIDFGVGTGTTALAMFDFLLAWSNVCDLYEAEFPILSVTFKGIDASKSCLEYAQKAVLALAESIVESSSVNTNNFFTKEIRWLKNSQWVQEDINNSFDGAKTYNDPTIVVASNIFNELSISGKERFERFISCLPDDSLAVIIEPGDRKKTAQLNKWRRELLLKFSFLKTTGPCGQEFKNTLPGQCDECWNARRESLQQPLLYKKFRGTCNKLLPDNRSRSFDEYQNNLLSWSYVVLSVARNNNVDRELDIMQDSKVRRYVGTFLKGKSSEVLMPVAGTPDESPVTRYKIDEYIKICPGLSKQNLAEIKRQPGMQCHDLRHGELINLTSVSQSPFKIIEQNQLILSPDEKSLLDIAPVEQDNISSVFLNSYTGKVQQAIDGIAYRLFGFPSMRPFQHKILERALTGNNIFGIAATGGGKSECYILPAMILPGITVVIAPLKSLMQDQFEQRIKDRYGLGSLTTFINGDVEFKERENRLKRLTLGYYKLLYLTPEQLEKGYILSSLEEADRKHTIRYLALDEAHCISQWGHDFRPSYLNMIKRLNTWNIHPVKIALTATASPEVRQDLCEELSLNPDALESGGDVYIHSSNRHELNLIVRIMPNMNEKSDAIMQDLQDLLDNNKRTRNQGAALVFLPYTGGNPENTWGYMPDEKNYRGSLKGKFSTGVTAFASFIERALQERITIYHGKMDNEDEEESNKAAARKLGDLQGRTRNSQQKAFIDGKSSIMVATKGFGMGIDKSNIRLIVHRTPTSNLEAYAQEAGRAGRDGDIAHSILYYSPDSKEESDGKGKPRTIPSDHDIQRRFLSGKYIRYEDMMVMYAFLNSMERNVGKYLYFTNDQAIDFFDKCETMPQEAGIDSFEWPEFPKRDSRQFESDDHQIILDRGHIYQEKTGYLKRILSVAYRIRPDYQGTRLSFLDELQETGAVFTRNKITIRNIEGILGSNCYFGKLFREKKLSSSTLRQWFNTCARNGLIEFAQFLELSLRETASLFQDIKRTDGLFSKSNKWIPALLDFQSIIAPKYGPAKDAMTLTQKVGSGLTYSHY